MRWERVGYVPNVVFGSAALVEPDGDTLRVYWGGADTVVCTGTVPIQALIDAALSGARPEKPAAAHC